MRIAPVVCLSAVMMGTLVPIGAVELTIEQYKSLHHTRLMQALDGVSWTRTGKQLPKAVREALRQMPADHRLEENQVVLIDDLSAFAELTAKVTVGIQVPACETIPTTARCSDLIGVIVERDLSFMRTLNAFVLNNSYPVFLNGGNKILTALARGAPPAVVRFFSSRLVHEREHAIGQVAEAPCYALEVKYLLADYNRGLLPGFEGVIREIQGFYQDALKEEKGADAIALFKLRTNR